MKIRKFQNQYQVFDIIRHKYVKLTPEEDVRQQFIQYMIDYLHIPTSCIAVESEHKLFGKTHRTDIVVYNQQAQICLLVECKAPNIVLDEKVISQLARYQVLTSSLIWVMTNGTSCLSFQYNKEKECFLPLNEIPVWEQLQTLHKRVSL